MVLHPRSLWFFIFRLKSINLLQFTYSINISIIFILYLQICMFWAEKKSVAGKQLGSPGLAIEIYETKIDHCKYNRGRLVKGQWIFEGYERGSKKVFIMPVKDWNWRNARGMYQAMDIARNNDNVRLLEVLQLFKQWGLPISDGKTYLQLRRSRYW